MVGASKELPEWMDSFNEKREFTHFVTQPQPKDIKNVESFVVASDDYIPNERGFLSSTFAIHSASYLDGYDYFTANANCYQIYNHYREYKDRLEFKVLKASFWGKHEQKITVLSDPAFPKGTDYLKTLISIKIPDELIGDIFRKIAR